MVGGQAIDLQAAGQAPERRVTLDADGLRAMHARKTGALIRAAASAARSWPAPTTTLIAAIDRYAAEVGLAFQIVDDILDVEGGAGGARQDRGKDAAADKPTYPALFGLDDRARSRPNACSARTRALDGARI